jgi:hypothetical protein
LYYIWNIIGWFLCAKNKRIGGDDLALIVVLRT